MDQLVVRRAQDLVNRHRAGQVAGLYRAGVQLYRHRAQIADMARYAYRTARRAYNRYSNRPSKFNASGLPSSSGSRIGRPKYRGRRRYSRRRYVKGRGYRSRYKSKKRIMATTMKMKAWQIHNYGTATSIQAAPKSTYFYGVDVGLGGDNYTVNAPHVYCLANDGGEIFTFFKKYFGVTPSSTDRYVEWKSNLYLTLKNQCNFGCFLKVYYIKTPISSSIVSADTINEIIARHWVSRTTFSGSHALDLTDQPGIQKELKITHRKMIKMDPGQTINLKLKSSSRGVKNLSNMIYRTRNKYTRTLLIQATGFPVHDKEFEANVTTSAIHLDLVAMHKIKGRIGEDVQNKFEASNSVQNVEEPVGHQFQKGEEADMS